MPEQVLEKLRKSIPSQWKVCFFSAVIVGLIAHLYKIANWLPNWDSLVFRYDAQNMLALGRWFLPVVCAPSSFYDLPWLTGLLAILFHGLGAVCICRMFRVEKGITAALIGAAVIPFPTVTSVLLYNYVADGYAIAFFLSCLSAMFLTGEKPRYLAAVAAITLSAGIYQAYITVTVTLLLCFLLTQALHGTGKVSGLLRRAAGFLISGIAGVVLYYLILTLLLKLTGTALLEYQGADSALALSGLNLPASLYAVKTLLFDWFFDFSSGASVFTVMNCIAGALVVILYLAGMIVNRTGPAKVAVVVVCGALLPFGAGALAFLNGEIDYHNLMKMGFFAFYLLLILEYEKAEFRNEKRNAACAWVILCAVAVIVCNQTVLANVSYHKLNLAYEKSYGTLIRIADRIEQTDGAGDCDRILVLGALPGSEAYAALLPPDMTGTTDGYILRADDEVVGQSVLCSALNDYCGTEYSFLAGEEKAALLAKIGADAIAVWPDADSIFVIDGVIVISLGNERQ